MLSRPGAQMAARNFGWLIGEKCVRLFFGVGIGFWVARYLGPVRLGTLSYCTAIVTLLSFLPSLGIDAVLKRDLLQNPHKTAELLFGSFILRLGAGILTFAVLLVVAYMGWGLSEEESRLLMILGLMVIQPALFLPELWLQVQLRARLSVTVQLTALVLSSAMRIWLILHDASLEAFAFVGVLEMFFCGIGLFIAARRAGLRGHLMSGLSRTMKRLMFEGWPLMFTSLAIFIYLRIDEVMLRQLVGVAAVGIYAAATKLSEVWYFLPTALASSLLPALLRARQQGAETYSFHQQKYYDLSAAIAYGLSVPIALAAPMIVRLAYGAEFVAAGPILAVHIWSSIFVFLGVARGQWLVNEGMQRFYLAATVAGAVANVGLNFILIPRYAGLGAAYATVISYALAGWLASYFHPFVRTTAAMQTRALMIPLRGWRYLWR